QGRAGRGAEWRAAPAGCGRSAMPVPGGARHPVVLDISAGDHDIAKNQYLPPAGRREAERFTEDEGVQTQYGRAPQQRRRVAAADAALLKQGCQLGDVLTLPDDAWAVFGALDL